jgi:hypothetical protein
MRIFVLTATYELRVSRKSHLRDHPNCDFFENLSFSVRVFFLHPFVVHRDQAIAGLKDEISALSFSNK